MSHDSTRRDFLAAASAAGAALTTLAAAPAVHADGSDLIKVGLIGCGGRGTGAADNVLHSAKGVKIVAIGDVFKGRMEGCRSHLTNLAKNDKIKELGNAVDLPESKCFVGLDAFEKVIASDANYIILATPPGFRPQHLQAAVAAGKNIFTEKPVAVDGPGIRKVMDAYEEALKKKLAIVAGTQRRHQLGYVETMKRIQDGAIGDVVNARAYWNQNDIWFKGRKQGVTDLAYQLDNWYHFMWLCGDHIVEQHVHNLDVCNWAFNAHPVSCVGMGGRIARKGGDPRVVGQIYDSFAVDYVYPSGAHMLSMCRQIDDTAGNVSEALVGTKGNCNPGSYSIGGKKVLTREQDRASVDPYVQEHTDLIASIRASKPLNELKQVAESTLTAIMGRMSAYTGKEIKWEQALNSTEDSFPTKLDWDMSIEVTAAPIPGRRKAVKG